ncbi:uncharacterized protein KY384_001211 [Bacidia gigantensis]|uniref:uncharacterized protein n=1 Tax=Bacidia gigantensis TaxID=2732470 RepID=UPI001D04333A|nr:uncharacterized protein KY384_001211 [Bacidia gigantensis]KAG8534366.1 hypothetical protein KY384_001211 [Bacidia gigantensis]
MSAPSDEGLPSRPKEEAGEEKGPSKSALKKAQKDREKAEKLAKRLALEEEQRMKAEASDTAKHLYGPLSGQSARPVKKFCKSLQDLESVAEDEEVTVQARIYNARAQGAKLAFLVLREQEHTIQVVVAEGGAHGISRQMIKYCAGVNTESFVRVTGLVKAPKDPVHSTSLSNQELHLESLYVVSPAEEQLPLQVKDCIKPPSTREEGEGEADTNDPNATLKTRLDNKILATRAPATNAIFQLQSEICTIYSQYMLSHGFTMIQPSYLAGAATEGGSGVFEVTYFERKAYLTQSPQFFKQMAIAGDIGPVFSIGPVFRAENSNTKRHLTEFTGLDYEMPIQEHYHEVLSFGEDLMLHLIRQLLSRPKSKHLTSIIRDAGYPDAGNFQVPPEGTKATRITFQEAKTLLKDSGFDIGTDPHADIDTAQEKALGDLIKQKYNTDFFTIDQYPLSLRPFYTHPSPSNPELSNSYDFFMRGQEIMSGAQRIHELPMLKEMMKAKGVNPVDPGFKDYEEAFRYGCPMHGGGGLGLNRILQFFLGLNNIREATLFPRDPVRLGP